MATVKPASRQELHDRFDAVAGEICDALILARATLVVIDSVKPHPAVSGSPDDLNLAIDMARLAVAAVDRSGDMFEDLQREMLDRFAPCEGEKRPKPAPLVVV